MEALIRIIEGFGFNFGLKVIVGIILTVILVVGLIWFIAYSTAEPGEKVSIFFGLVEYTKGKSQIGPRAEARIKQEAEPQPKERKVHELDRHELSGSITFPPPSKRVVRRFRVKGTVWGEYRHLWLVEHVGQLYWPKEPELMPQNGRWIGEVNEGGWPPGGKIKVLLLDVSDEVSSRFQEWLENGHRTGHYPGLTGEELGDANILDSKEYQLITE